MASREVVTNSPHWPPSDIGEGEYRRRPSNTTGCRLLRSNFVTLERFPGYSEASSAGCKQFSVGLTAPDDSGSTATAQVAVNGMDPPDSGFPPAEANAESPGQWHHTHP